MLRWKGATLVRQRAMRLAAKDPAIADRFRSLQLVSRRLDSLSRTPPAGDFDNWKTKITDLTAEKEQLEAQLSRNRSVFQPSMEEITAQQIQAAIPRDAVLVDYLQFTRSRPSEKKGQWAFTTSLLAVLVKPEGELLLSHIAEAATILVSTDGPLGRIPLGALPGKEPGKYLPEVHRIAMIPVPQLLPALVDDAAPPPHRDCCCWAMWTTTAKRRKLMVRRRRNEKNGVSASTQGTWLTSTTKTFPERLKKSN